jgi:excisionase family DNA binding protein
MAGDKAREEQAEMLDVRRAAALTGRHPETIRRWVWSGRLAARREGNRLLIVREDLEALAGTRAPGVVDLAAWADRARRARAGAGAKRSRRSAADLVIEDRAGRSRSVDARAGH